MPEPTRRERIRNLALTVIAVLCLVGTLAAMMYNASKMAAEDREGASDERVGQPAPDFRLRALSDGSERALSDAAGKVVLIDFWATFCGPCRRSMPELQQLWERYSDHDFVIYSVNVDQPSPQREDLVERYMTHNELTFDTLIDNGSTAWTYGAERIPMMYIVGRDGTIRRVFRGYTDPRVVERAVTEALAETSAPSPGS